MLQYDELGAGLGNNPVPVSLGQGVNPATQVLDEPTVDENLIRQQLIERGDFARARGRSFSNMTPDEFEGAVKAANQEAAKPRRADGTEIEETGAFERGFKNLYHNTMFGITEDAEHLQAVRENQASAPESTTAHAKALHDQAARIDSEDDWMSELGTLASDMISNPGETGKVMAEQIANSLPSMATVAAGALGAVKLASNFHPASRIAVKLITGLAALAGGTAGSYLGSGGTEYVAEKAQRVLEKVKDPNDIESIKAAIDDPSIMGDAERAALLKGHGVGVADALSFLTTGGIAAFPGAGPVVKTLKGTLGFGVETAGELGGEYYGQHLQKQEGFRDDIDMGDVYMEGALGAGQSMGTTVIANSAKFGIAQSAPLREAQALSTEQKVKERLAGGRVNPATGAFKNDFSAVVNTTATNNALAEAKTRARAEGRPEPQVADPVTYSDVNVAESAHRMNKYADHYGTRGLGNQYVQESFDDLVGMVLSDSSNATTKQEARDAIDGFIDTVRGYGGDEAGGSSAIYTEGMSPAELKAANKETNAPYQTALDMQERYKARIAEEKARKQSIAQTKAEVAERKLAEKATGTKTGTKPAPEPAPKVVSKTVVEVKSKEAADQAVKVLGPTAVVEDKGNDNYKVTKERLSNDPPMSDPDVAAEIKSEAALANQPGATLTVEDNIQEEPVNNDVVTQDDLITTPVDNEQEGVQGGVQGTENLGGQPDPNPVPGAVTPAEAQTTEPAPAPGAAQTTVEPAQEQTNVAPEVTPEQAAVGDVNDQRPETNVGGYQEAPQDATPDVTPDEDPRELAITEAQAKIDQANNRIAEFKSRETQSISVKMAIATAEKQLAQGSAELKAAEAMPVDTSLVEEFLDQAASVEPTQAETDTMVAPEAQKASQGDTGVSKQRFGKPRGGDGYANQRGAKAGFAKRFPGVNMDEVTTVQDKKTGKWFLEVNPDYQMPAEKGSPASKLPYKMSDAGVAPVEAPVQYAPNANLDKFEKLHDRLANARASGDIQKAMAAFAKAKDHIKVWFPELSVNSLKDYDQFAGAIQAEEANRYSRPTETIKPGVAETKEAVDDSDIFEPEVVYDAPTESGDVQKEIIKTTALADAMFVAQLNQNPPIRVNQNGIPLDSDEDEYSSGAPIVFGEGAEAQVFWNGSYRPVNELELGAREQILQDITLFGDTFDVDDNQGLEDYEVSPSAPINKRRFKKNTKLFGEYERIDPYNSGSHIRNLYLKFIGDTGEAAGAKIAVQLIKVENRVIAVDAFEDGYQDTGEPLAQVSFVELEKATREDPSAPAWEAMENYKHPMKAARAIQNAALDIIVNTANAGYKVIFEGSTDTRQKLYKRKMRQLGVEHSLEDIDGAIYITVPPTHSLQEDLTPDEFDSAGFSTTRSVEEMEAQLDFIDSEMASLNASAKRKLIELTNEPDAKVPSWANAQPEMAKPDATVVTHAKNLAKRILKASGHKVVVVTSKEEFIANNPKVANRILAKHPTVGGYYNRVRDESVVLVWPGQTDEEISKVILHETVGHGGMEKLFGNKWLNFMNKIIDTNMKALIDSFANTPPNYGHKAYNLTGSELAAYRKNKKSLGYDWVVIGSEANGGILKKVTRKHAQMLIREHIARQAERFVTDPKLLDDLSPGAKHWFHRVMAYVRHLLRPYVKFKVTDEDILSLLAESHDRTVEGKNRSAYMEDVGTQKANEANDLMSERYKYESDDIWKDRWEKDSKRQLRENDEWDGIYASEVPQSANENNAAKAGVASTKGHNAVDVSVVTDGMRAAESQVVWLDKARQGADRMLRSLRNVPYIGKLMHNKLMPGASKFEMLNRVHKGRVDANARRATQLHKMLAKLPADQLKKISDAWTGGEAFSALGLNPPQVALLTQGRKDLEDIQQMLNTMTYKGHKILTDEQLAETGGKFLHTEYMAYLAAYRGSGKTPSGFDWMKRRTATKATEAQLEKISNASYTIPSTLGLVGRDAHLLRFMEDVAENAKNKEGPAWVVDSSATFKVGLAGGDQNMTINQVRHEIDRTATALNQERMAHVGTNTEAKAILESNLDELNRVYSTNEEARLDNVANAMYQSGGKYARVTPSGNVQEKLVQDLSRDEKEAFLEENFIWVTEKDYPNLLPFQGKYVHKEIINEFTQMDNSFEADGVQKNGFAKAVGDATASGGVLDSTTRAWKLSKTGLNIPAYYMRNLVGNFFLLDLSTSTNAASLTIDVGREALATIKGNGKKYGDHTLKEWADKFGLYSTTYGASELYFLADDFERQMKKDAAKKNNQFMKMAGFEIKDSAMWLAEKTANMHGLMEGIFKQVVMKDYIDRWEKGEAGKRTPRKFNSLSATEQMGLMAAATEEAGNAIFDYDKVPNWARTLRRTPFGTPFMTFNYKMAGALPRAMLKHPWKLARYYAAPGMASAALMATGIADFDDDEMEEISKKVPWYMRNRSGFLIMPLKDANGKVQYFDLTYIFPPTLFTDAYLKMMNQEPGDNVAGAFKDLAFGDLGLLGGPIPQALTAGMANKDPFTGRDIWVDGDLPVNNWERVATWTWNMAMPPVLTEGGALGRSFNQAGIDLPVISSGQEFTKYGTDKETGAQTFWRGMGLSGGGFSPAEAMKSNEKRFSYKLNQVQKAMRKAAVDPNKDRLERIDAVRAYEAQIREMKQHRMRALSGR